MARLGTPGRCGGSRGRSRPVTGSGALGAVTVAARDVADFQPVIAPGDRTVLGSPPGSHAWHTWPLP